MQIQTKTTDAVAYAGSKSNLAKTLSIARQSLTSWGPFLPQTSAQKLYILTDGKIGRKINENKEKSSTPTNPKTSTNCNPMFYP